jgi:LPS-assembly lipoprotein
MRFLIVILSFFVASCGFTPLYGTNNHDESVQRSLQSIKITPINGRLGQLLTNALIEDIYKTAEIYNVKYELSLTVDEETSRHGYNQDRSTTRESYSQTVNFKLINIENQKELTTGVAVARTSYDVAQSDFSNFKAKQDALERMVNETSQSITRKLSVYFKNNPQ